MSDLAIQAGMAAARAGTPERKVAAAIYQSLVLAGSDTPAFPRSSGLATPFRRSM